MRHFQKVQQLLITTHFVLIKEVMAILIDRYADVFAFVWTSPETPRQIHFDSFNVHLTQAHHHKTGEQKEHDVDQRMISIRAFLCGMVTLRAY